MMIPGLMALMRAPRAPQATLSAIDAYLEGKLDEVAQLAEAALHDPDPWHGLVTHIEQASELQMQDRGLIVALRRYLAIFLDGMRGDRGPTSELPVEALSIERASEAFGAPGDRRDAR